MFKRKLRSYLNIILTFTVVITNWLTDTVFLCLNSQVFAVLDIFETECQLHHVMDVLQVENHHS